MDNRIPFLIFISNQKTKTMFTTFFYELPQVMLITATLTLMSFVIGIPFGMFASWVMVDLPEKRHRRRMNEAAQAHVKMLQKYNKSIEIKHLPSDLKIRFA